MIFLFNFINPLKGIQVYKVKQEMLDILVCEGLLNNVCPFTLLLIYIY